MMRERWRPPGSVLMRVKRPADILKTLDADGKLDGLPFMPEMVKYCGNCIRVHRRAERTCVVGEGFRSMQNAVFLQEARCDGSAHDGCDRGCLLFWKLDWLTPAGDAPAMPDAGPAQDDAAARALRQLPTRTGARYLCQSTELKAATAPLHRWDIRPLLRDMLARELPVSGFIRIVAGALWRRTGAGRRQPLAGSPGRKSRGDLDLQPGEWVALKPAGELCKYLDEKGGNCGLGFPPTMIHAIGQRYRVAGPVRRIILERTGTMVELSNTVALEGLLCEGTEVANCPRAEYLYCRESWLHRTTNAAADARADGA